MADACERCACACGACQGLCTLHLCECEDDDAAQEGWARFFCDSIPSVHGQGVQALRRGDAKFHEGIPSVTARGFGAKGVSSNLGGQGAQAAEIKFHEGRPVIWGKQTGGQGVQANRGGESATFDESIPNISAKANSGKGVTAHRGDAKFDERRPYVLTRLSGGQGVTARRGWDGEAE